MIFLLCRRVPRFGRRGGEKFGLGYPPRQGLEYMVIICSHIRR